MSDEEVEAEVNGVKVAAHVKALPQIGGDDQDLVWNVKAIGRDGHFIDLKALDKAGNIFPVKALCENGNAQVMDIKAFVDGKKLPVKVLVGNDRFSPVKAIGADGTIYDIKCITPEKKILDVKAVAREGNIFHIKAIGADGEQLGVKAISPRGELRDVKGLKFMATDTEMTLNGVAVRAHIKALPQLP